MCFPQAGDSVSCKSPPESRVHKSKLCCTCTETARACASIRGYAVSNSDNSLQTNTSDSSVNSCQLSDVGPQFPPVHITGSVSRARCAKMTRRSVVAFVVFFDTEDRGGGLVVWRDYIGACRRTQAIQPIRAAQTTSILSIACGSASSSQRRWLWRW